MPISLRVAFGIGTAVFTVAAVHGQDFPTKPLRIVTSGIGGSSDFAARLIAQGLSGTLGQQVIVDNRPSGVIPGQVVSAAQPDGYTLLLTSNSLWVGSLLQHVPYDVVKDFAPVALVARSLNVLVVHPSLPVNSVKELIALAKAKPGALNYASGGTGGTGHLTGELFKSMAGVNIVHVPYKSAATAISDVLSGQVQMTFDSASTVIPLAKAGKLRALAVTSAEPTELVAGLPAVAAFLPGFESVITSGMLAPAKTPAVTIKRLNQEIDRTIRTPDVKEKFFGRGMDVVYSSPEQFAATIRTDLVTMGKVIKDAGIKAE